MCCYLIAMFLGALPLPDIVEDLLSVGVVGQLLAALLLLLPLLLLLVPCVSGRAAGASAN